MKLLSLNVGPVANVPWQGKTVATAIFKQSTTATLRVNGLGLEGDAVADLEVHGGEHKAVYAFPFEHYDYFAAALQRTDFVPGQFGENLTTTGLLESAVRIGDRLRIGGALFEVTQPREPCFKLGIRMNDSRIVKLLLESRRTGFYLRVLEEGELAAGMDIRLEPAAGDALSVSEITRVCYFDREDRPTVARAAALDRLTPSWRLKFQQRLEELTGIKTAATAKG